MNYYLTILLTSAAFFICCTPPQETTVHLKGQLLDMGSNTVTLSYDGAASLIGDSKDITLLTDNEGNFDTILTITEPSYYRISRNTIYLTPGDDMTVKITTNNQEAEFNGKGSEVNNYMKYRLFPKGGSYLEGGSNVRKSYEDTKKLIDSLSTIRISKLNSLQEATNEFKELELARIKADIANSYLSFASYAIMKERKLKTEEDYKHFSDSLFKKAVVDAKPIFKELNKDKFLNVAVVRDIMHYIINPRDEQTIFLAEGLTISPYMNELYKSASYVNKLRGKISKELINEINKFIETMQNPEFITEIKAKIGQATRLMTGQPAIDFEIKDTKGNIHKLSEFKGKTIYLDFWATWCGPCVQETPYFEKLAKEFKGKDIVFVPISTDKNKEEWIKFITAHKKEIPQYNSLDEKLNTDWAIHYIPRFVIIDKDFKIVDAYAPRPSEANAKQLLESLTK